MDEKIEEMTEIMYQVEAFELETLAEALYNAGYRKESDTASEILTLIKNGVELNSMIEGDDKIAIMNELRWAGQKYGVDFTNS